jgi:O-antigen ligase
MNKEKPSQPIIPKDSIFSLTFVVLALYLLLDFLPKDLSIDVEGIQWLSFSILNLVLAIYVALQIKKNPDFFYFRFTSVAFLYTVFILICGVSIVVAENKEEGYIAFSKLLTTYSGGLLLFFISQKKQSFLLNFSIFISCILFIQSIGILANYFKLLTNNDFGTVSTILSGNAGNQNILASSFLFKLPFLFYGLHYLKNNFKYFLLITLFTTTFVLFLTNSKTNVISLILFGFVAVLFYNFSIKNSVKFKSLLPVYAIIITAFICSKLIPFEQEVIIQENTAYDNLNDYSGTRLFLWENSIEIANKNPLIGSSLGSYKIESIPYEAKNRSDWRISKYAHNDFFQIAAETGYLGMIVFVLLLVLPFYFSVKKVIKKRASEEEKWIAFMIILTAIGYGFDSLINFPLHRPITQIHFILFLFLIHYSGFLNNKVVFNIKSQYLLGCIALLSAITLYPNYKNYQSLIGQNLVLSDEQTLILSYDEVNDALPNFPNISALGYSVDALRARYLIRDNRLDEAKKILWNSKSDNKNYRFNESLLAEVYEKENNLDSLLYYRKQCFETWPLYQPFYQNYLVALKNAKDLDGINAATNYVKKYNKGEDLADLNSIIKQDLGDIKKVDSVQNSSKFSAPTKTILNQEMVDELIRLNTQFEATPKEEWKSILDVSLQMHKIQPENAAYNCNIGMAYFKLNLPKKALPYLKNAYQSNTMSDGLPEFLLGICYLNSSQKEKGCKFLQEAIAKKICSCSRNIGKLQLI